MTFEEIKNRLNLAKKAGYKQRQAVSLLRFDGMSLEMRKDTKKIPMGLVEYNNDAVKAYLIQYFYEVKEEVVENLSAKEFDELYSKIEEADPFGYAKNKKK